MAERMGALGTQTCLPSSITGCTDPESKTLGSQRVKPGNVKQQSAGKNAGHPGHGSFREATRDTVPVEMPPQPRDPEGWES